MELLAVEERKNHIYKLLETIDDPELPISIVDLGIVEDVTVSSETIDIKLIPTFSGCPALEYIENLVKEEIRKSYAGIHVKIGWNFNGDWGSERISNRGVKLLQDYGIAIAFDRTVNCPYCGSTHAIQETAFGSSLCREIYYCKACKNPFEKMKHLKGKQ